MDHATIAQVIIGFAGVGIGTVIGGFFAGAKHKALRETIADLEGKIEAHGRRIGRLLADNLRLKPQAEAHLKTLAQRDAALAKAKAANAARKAAKAANGASAA